MLKGRPANGAHDQLVLLSGDRATADGCRPHYRPLSVHTFNNFWLFYEQFKIGICQNYHIKTCIIVYSKYQVK